MRYSPKNNRWFGLYRCSACGFAKSRSVIRETASGRPSLLRLRRLRQHLVERLLLCDPLDVTVRKTDVDPVAEVLMRLVDHHCLGVRRVALRGLDVDVRRLNLRLGRVGQN